MTLDQLHDLKLWHQRHLRERPVEKQVWDTVLTLWMMGWVGAPVAFLIHFGWALVLAFPLVSCPVRMSACADGCTVPTSCAATGFPRWVENRTVGRQAPG